MKFTVHYRYMRNAMHPQTKALLYGPRGEVVRSASSGYLTSGSFNRALRGWLTIPQSADVDILAKLETMRSDCRDLSMNSPIALAALNRYATNVIGYGLRYQSRIDRNYLNLDDKAAEAWERNTEEEFGLWAESQDCSADRSTDFYGLQYLTYFSKLLSGDIFALLPMIPRPGSRYDLRVRLLEADMVSNPDGRYDDDRVAGGIEVDEHGAPAYYHIASSHPGGYSTTPRRWERIAAFGAISGRRNVLHMFDQFRPGQRRGVPLLAPVIVQLKQLSRLTEAELMAAVVTSFFTVFIKTPSGDSMDMGLDPSVQVTNGSTRADDSNVQEIGSGSMIDLATGEDVVIADPKRPNSAFQPFFEGITKQVGAGIGVPFEVLLEHFSSSYSASRAALLLAWKSFFVHRHSISRTFCQPVFDQWLAEAVYRGHIEAPGFFDDPRARRAWSKAAWIGPGQGQIQPKTETDAALARIAGKLSTHAKEVAQLDGDDWDSQIERGASEARRVAELFPQTQEQPNG